MLISMDERELDKLFPLTARMVNKSPYVYLNCPDAIGGRHGPADAYGKCPWCGKKYEQAVSFHPSAVKGAEVSSYEYHYNPDYGTDNLDRY